MEIFRLRSCSLCDVELETYCYFGKRESKWSVSKYYCSMCNDEMRKTTRNINQSNNQNSRTLHHDIWRKVLNITYGC